MRPLALLLLVPLLLAACGPDLDNAIAAYRAGRFDEAHEQFALAQELSLDGGPVEAAYGRALSALRIGDVRDAESAVDSVAARAEGDLEALAAFLRGNVQYARSELAARQAGAAEAEPFAYDLAILHAEKARQAWQTAALTRRDWPEARRNVERALQKVVELRRKRAEKQDQVRRQREPRVRPRPAPTAERPPVDPEAAPDASGQTVELSSEQVLGLLERLAEKEREKLGARRTRRASEQSGVERDW